MDEKITVDNTAEPLIAEEENSAGTKSGIKKLFGKMPVKNFGNKLKQKLGKLGKKQKIIIICITVAVLAASGVIVKCSTGKKVQTDYEILKVERRDITRTIEASSTAEANDTYDVTALVTGEILEDTFNEGDTVEKDQMLYTIDSADAQRSVDSAQNSLTKAQQSFTDAVKKKADTLKSNDNNKKTTQNSITKSIENVETAKRNLESAQKDVNELTIKSDYSGKISEVLVKQGDSVNDGTKIAAIYDDSYLKVQLPFNESDVQSVSVGSDADVRLTSSSDTISGEVESVSGAASATDAHAIVRYITIKLKNPGGLKAGEKVSASVNGISCSDLGVLENYDEGYITAKSQGRISELWLAENDNIIYGQTIGYIESDNAENSLKSAQASLKTAQLDLNDSYTKLEQLVIDSSEYQLDSSIKNAELELDNARISLENANKKLEDYKITAPIDGTIVTKNKKAGDKLEQNNSSSSEPMAVIYDMSVLKIQLSVDESEIQEIQLGQSVSITADAAEGRFTGEITKVGVNGTSQNGVTVYPVEVTIAEYGDMLPGMNVDCVIEVESVHDALAVPVAAIQRGGSVYVRGDKTDEHDKAPEGFYTVKVETGATDSMYIEIKEGLSEEQEICGAVKSSGNEAKGNAESQQQQQMGGPMGGMGGGPMGGGAPGGMRSGSGGGNRGGMGGGPR